jgi:CBS domain-containing protein
MLREIMQRSVATVSPAATAAEAARMMGERGIGCLLVVQGSKVAGIVTERDLLLKVMAPGRDAASVRISEIMSGPLVAAGPEAHIGEAVGLMAEHRIRRLPVVKDGSLVGIVTASDILAGLQRALTELAEETARAAQEASRAARRKTPRRGQRTPRRRGP